MATLQEWQDTARQTLSDAYDAAERASRLMEDIGERIDAAAVRGEAMSRTATVDADGANAKVVTLAPRQGLFWVVSAIAVIADTTADRIVTVGLGDSPIPRALGNVTTASGTNGVGGFLPGNSALPIPAGMGVSALFPAAVPVGTKLILHIAGRELEDEPGVVAVGP